MKIAKRISILIFTALSTLAAAEAKTVYLDNNNASTDENHYTDAISALDAVNRLAASGAGKVTLRVAPGVYWLDDPDDPAIRKMPDNSIPYGFHIVCDTLEIIGSDGNPENTVFAVNRGQTRGAVGHYTMLHFKGSSLRVENMTLGNYCNVDLDYPLNPALNRAKRCAPIVQAQLGICEGTDRVYASNCRFISRLNLCPIVGGRRSFYKDCYFECTDDALTGSAVYLDCRFTFFSSKPFYTTDTTGAIFLNCDIDIKGKGPQYLTKAPGMVTMVDTRFSSSGNNMTIRWTRDESPIVSYHSGVTLNGESYAIDSDRPFMSVDISDTKLLDAYKICDGNTVIYNTPNLLAGDDGWDPLGQLSEIRKMEQRLGRKLTDLPVRMDFGVDRLSLKAKGDSKELDMIFRRWGNYPVTDDKIEAIQPLKIGYSYPNSVKLDKNGKLGHIGVESCNSMPIEAKGRIVASTDMGIQGCVDTKVEPYLKDAPDISLMPVLKIEDGKVTVDYRIDDVAEDRSHFEWYRCKSPDWSDSIAVCHGSGRLFASYPLSHADRNCYIGVRIVPKGGDTRGGKVHQLILDKPCAAKHIKFKARKEESSYVTDFSAVPVRLQPRIARGAWSFDSYKPADTAPHAWQPNPEECWYFGRATDASTGIGLVQWTRGARAFYTPAREKCRDMRAKLMLEPCKSAGQGFGSATGQYLDVYIKYNPETMSGYGLRVERTVDYDHAVVFTLMRYDNGTAVPVSKPQASTCYRTTCTVDLWLTDGILRATASTDADTADAQNSSAVEDKRPSPTVSLYAEVPDKTTATTFGLQHTGSTGASATLISKLELSWK